MANRVQVAPLRREVGLKPAPIAGDTYAPPPQVAPDRRYAQLADALGAFSNSLGNLQGVVGRESKEDIQAKTWAEEKKMAGLSNEEWAKKVEAGEVPVFTNKFQNQAIQAAGGMKYGAWVADQLRTDMIQNFDWDQDDPEAYVAKFTAEALDKYGADPNFGPQLKRQLDSVYGWAADYRNKRKTEQHFEDQKGAAFNVIDVKTDEMIKGDLSGEEMGKAIKQWYGELSKQGTLGLDDDQIDLEVMNKLERIAASEPERVLALINAPLRKDRSGADFTFMSSRVFKDRALQVQKTAQRALAERAEHGMIEGMREENVKALENGNLAFAQDRVYVSPVTGEEKTYTAKEQQDDARRLWLERSQSIAKGNREEMGSQLLREYRTLRNAGEKHPALVSALNGIADAASPDIVEDPDAFKKLLGRVRLYERVQAESANSVNAYVSDQKDKDFVETFLQAQRYMTHEDGRRFSEKEAMMFSIKVNGAPKEGLPRVKREEVDKAVQSLATDPGWLWDGEAPPENYSTAVQRVDSLASAMVASGVEPAKAVEMAGRAIAKTSTVYNGMLLDLQGMEVPPDFAEAMDNFIADFAEEETETMKRNGIEPGDITIEPIASSGSAGGRFRLVHKDNPSMPVLDDDGRQKFFTLKQVRELAGEIKKVNDEAVSVDTTIKSNAKARGLIRNSDGDYMDPDTKELYAVKGTTLSKTGKRAKGPAQSFDENGGIIFKSGTRKSIEAANKRIKQFLSPNPARAQWELEERARKNGHAPKRNPLAGYIPRIQIGPWTWNNDNR